MGTPYVNISNVLACIITICIHVRMLVTQDTAVTDTLAVLHFETQPDNPGQGMYMVKDRLERQAKEIQVQREQNKRFKEVIAGLKNDINMLTTEALSLKTMNNNINERLEAFTKQATQKITTLEKEIESLKGQLADKKDKLLFTQAKLNDNTNRLQVEIKTLKATLAQTTSELNTTTKDRDATRKELTEVTDRTRKLMTKLGMSNDIEKLGLSLDHARNLSYVTSRHGGTNLGHQRINMNVLPEAIVPDNETTLVKKQRVESTLGIPQSARNNTPRSNPHHVAFEEHVCLVCHKIYDEAKNFNTSCLYHEQNAVKLYMGTELEVWSCCRSRDTLRGCKMSRHTQPAQEDDC